MRGDGSIVRTGFGSFFTWWGVGLVTWGVCLDGGVWGVDYATTYCDVGVGLVGGHGWTFQGLGGEKAIGF